MNGCATPHPMTFERARSAAVVGGGTAGLFAALALAQVRPDLRISLVASPAIPVIGVGEATTPPLVAFLHGFLGLAPADLFRRVRPTWKLGIRFDWGIPGRPFHYAFGGGDLGAARRHEGHILDYSSTSRLMSRGRGLVARDGGALASLMPDHRFAYHLDNAPFVAYLAGHAEARGVRRVRATVAGVRRDDLGGIAALLLAGGGELACDVYVDASGFRSQLFGEVLEVPFLSYRSSLLCDAAVAGNGPLPAAGPAPFTRAATMSAGWCWTIPMRGEDHHGYVFSTAFLDPAAAEAELRSTYRIDGPTRLVRFQSGRRTDLVRANVAAVGNAYGFVEPLESTALHMAIGTSLRLAALAVGARDDSAAVGRELGEQWDYLRGFLALHYRFNAHSDTPFWRHCREHVDLGPLEPALAEYRAGTLFTQRQPPPAFVRDSVFGARGLDLVLLGQEVLPGRLLAEVDGEEWARRRAEWADLEEAALPHGDALAACDQDPALLDGLLEGAWIREMAAAMHQIAPRRARQRAQPTSVRDAFEPG